MSLHGDYVAKIKEQATRKSGLSNVDGQAREQERLLICSALIKCADISNVVRVCEKGENYFFRLVYALNFILHRRDRSGERSNGPSCLHKSSSFKEILKES